MTSHLTGTLARRAYLGLTLVDGGDEVRVGRLAPTSPAAEAGLAPGDVVLALDGEAMDTAAALRARLAELRAGDVRALRVRGLVGDEREVTLTAAARPLEQHAGCEVVYDEVRHGAARLRTVAVLPARGAGPLPWVLYVQGVGAASVETPSGTDRPLPALARALALGGFACVRLDRPGTGDSEGAPLTQLSLDDEIALVTDAFAALGDHPDLDPSRGWLLGHSLGAVVGAEVIARARRRPRGMMVYGGGVKTWTEYLEAACRRQWTLAGHALLAQDRALRAVQRFHASFLIEGRPLDEVLARWPEVASEPALHGIEPGGVIRGRPATYWQALQRLDVAGRLATLGAPVLSAWGTSDWQAERDDHHLLAAVVNEGHPGHGTLVEIAGADHGFAARASERESFAAADPGRLCAAVPGVLLGWLRTQRA